MNNGITGKVYLVGTGPGDPGLLTLKALECLKEAQVLLYDRLIPPRIENLAPPNCIRIYVGKSSSQHTLPQKDICHKLVELAREGYRVVRLKGGDPFLFGRGGEEAEKLYQEGVPFEVIPGITSAISVPAYAGIPVTHRDHASSVAVITGHQAANEKRFNYSRFANAADTLVFLMGVENLANITQELQDGGLPATQPAALIRWGTRSEQMTVTGTLQNIYQKSVEEGMNPPAILVVGNVASLRETLRWREMMPLFGKRVVVTRALEQAGELSTMIEKLGGEAWEFPAIKIVPPDSWEQLDSCLDNLQQYSWMVFTSVNGVKFFFKRLKELNKDIRDLAGIKLVSIGPRTANSLKERGLQVHLVPQEYRAEGVIEKMLPLMKTGEKVLLPRATEAREILPVKLSEAGMKVEEIPAYKTLPGKGNRESLIELLREERIQVITFTSSSTVRNFLDQLGDEASTLLQGVVLASIGPITSATLKERGFYAEIEAREYTLPGLMKALLNHYGEVTPYD